MKKTVTFLVLFASVNASSFAQKVGIGTVQFTPTNLLDVRGNMSIGSGYAGIATASPTNGLIVEGNLGVGTYTTGQKLHVNAGNISLDNTYSVLFAGSSDGNWKMYRNSTADFTKSLVTGASLNINAFNAAGEGFAIGRNGGNSYYEILGSGPTHYFRGNVGIDVTAPQNKLDVEGGAVIGATYSGTNTAPTNGLLVEGKVGIGTNNPTLSLDVRESTGPYSSPAIGGFNGGSRWNYMHIGSGDHSFIWNTGSAMRFGTETSIASGYSELMRITSAGNVGIGVGGPQNKLDVEGSVAIGVAYSGTNAAPANGLVVQGNVGIGTTTTYAQLSNVITTAGTNDLVLGQYVGRETSGTAAAGMGVYSCFFLEDAGGSLIRSGGIASVWKDASAVNRYPRLDFYTSRNNSDLLAMSIDHYGNVGIGTSTMTKKLHLQIANAGSIDDGIIIERASTSTFGFKMKSDGSALYRGVITATGNSPGVYPEKEVMTFPLDDGNWGNVGIGVTAPKAYLDLKGVADVVNSVSLLLRSGNNTTNFQSNQILFGYNGSDGYKHAIKTRHNASGQAGNSIDFYTWYQGVDASTSVGTRHVMTLDGNGRVGIGSTIPTVALDVAGAICATGNVGGTSYTACSDKRYKKNITPLHYGLSEILKVNPVNYYWRQDEFPEKAFTNNEQIGFIAQEIELIFPALVATDEKGFKSVDYSRLTPILVQAIKEQQLIIHNLQSINDSQQKSINSQQLLLDDQHRIVEELKTDNKKLLTDVSLIKSQLNTLMQVTGKIK